MVRGEGGLLEARLEPPLEVRVELVPSQSSCCWGLEGGAGSSWRGLEGSPGAPGAGGLRTVMEAVLREAGGAVGVPVHSELSLPAGCGWKCSTFPGFS